MNSATGDDLSINASYAAEAVSILFELYQREIISPNSCGKWYREGVRAEQLAYKLIVCAESLQTLGQLAEALAFALTPQATALINCLYIESTSLYPALRSAAGDARESDQLCNWIWLKSIEHQDWLRSHLACLEGLARVLHLALSSRCPYQSEVNEPFMDADRQRSLHDAQLSSAIKRFCLACETCHLNLRTLEKSQNEPWEHAPWKLIKPAHINLDDDAVFSPICTWVTELGIKCNRNNIDPIGHGWDTNRHVLGSLLLLDVDFDSETGPPTCWQEKRRSSVRWTDDEGGKLERGSSLLAFKQSAGSPRSSDSCRYQKALYVWDRKLKPIGSAIIDEEQPKQRFDVLVPLSCSHKDCSQHAMQPPLFADHSSLSKHMKLIHKRTLPCPLRREKRTFDPHTGHEDSRDHRSSYSDTEDQPIFSNNGDLPDLRETPPTRSSTPAIDIPQHKSRQCTYNSSSTQVLSPMISPTDKNAFSPSGSTLSQLAELSALLETDIKPTVYTFIHRTSALSPMSRLDSRDSRSDFQRPSLNEYYAILDHLINAVIKPANRILPSGGRNSIASREQRRVVREADQMVALLDRWAGEGSRRGSAAGEHQREMEREWERERGRRSRESSRSRDRFYSISPRGDETGFFGKSN